MPSRWRSRSKIHAQDKGAAAAEAWANAHELIDLQLSPLGLVAMDALAPKSADVILDVGCGAGETVFQLAERVEQEGQVIGVDIAPRLLQLAATRVPV